MSYSAIHIKDATFYLNNRCLLDDPMGQLKLHRRKDDKGWFIRTSDYAKFEYEVKYLLRHLSEATHQAKSIDLDKGLKNLNKSIQALIDSANKEPVIMNDGLTDFDFIEAVDSANIVDIMDT